MILLDARPVSDCLIAAVSAAIANPADNSQAAYNRSEVPGGNRNNGQIPDLYAVIDVERRFDESSVRLGAPSGTTSWRCTVSADGKTVREAEWVLARAMRSLEDVWLTISDGHEFICRFETYRAPEWDDGRAWGSVTFTCAT